MNKLIKQVMSLAKKDKNLITQEDSAMNQRISAATINSSSKANIQSMISQLGGAQLPTYPEAALECQKFCENFSTICDVLEKKYTELDKHSFNLYQNIIDHSHSLLEDAINEPGFFKPINFFVVVRDNWDLLKDEVATYEAIINIIKLMADYITGYELYIAYFEKKRDENTTNNHHIKRNISDDDITDIFN